VLTTPPSISAIVPARNEAACITAVVRDLLALRAADGLPLLLEVVVADNGSSDGTATLARAAGARVVDVPRPGYGQACWDAVQASTGDWLLFVDGDGAADPADAPALLSALGRGTQLAVGVRHDVARGAMSAPQWLGNRLACTLMRLIWQMPAQDLGPHRAITRTAFDAMDLRDRSFGWTVEMQVRAQVLGLRVEQLPVRWRVRAGGVSKISGTWRGVLGAGIGILGMISRLWWREQRRPTRAFVHPNPHPPLENTP
jgi:glycosyltransferase involved in cell wall biosynthesis